MDSRFVGSPDSLIDWKAMGQPGRNFITTGPDAAAIEAFSGRPALDPIRVYVGRANADTPRDRAELALAELKRRNAFDREVLVVVSPTGTGWMDPGSPDPLEYMHNGDIATVSVQYSYLNSPFALVFETRTGLDQATATVITGSTATSSMTAAVAGPVRNRMRARNQSRAIAPSSAPVGVGLPVQLRTAVNRNPVMTATTKPKTRSGLGHDMPDTGVPSAIRPE